MSSAVMQADTGGESWPLPQDSRLYQRAGWLVIMLGFAGFLLWAALAPLDKGVPVSGMVIIEGQRKTLHHPTGAQVEKIHVSEGEAVKAGQLLIQMNDTQLRAQAESLHLQLNDAIALLARLQAERDGTEQITFPVSNTLPAEVMQNQRSLFAVRQQALTNALAMQSEVTAGYRHQLQAAQGMVLSRKKQRDALAEQLEGVRSLVAKGHLPRNQLLEMERLHAQVDAGVSEETGRAGQLQRQIQESLLRYQAIQDEFFQEVHRQLAETTLRVQALNTHYQSALYELDNSRIVAPVDGVVTELSVFTEGGFVAREAHLLDIVPLQQQFLVQGQVPVNLIDVVHPGLEVNLLFPAFNQASTPQIPAVLTTVSADRLTDPASGMPYYRVQARVTEASMSQLAQHTIRPGMPVELFIKTGERSLFSYLLKPVVDRSRIALAEE